MEKYTLIGGKTSILYNKNMDHNRRFKVNLPFDEDSFSTGNGEGIVCTADETTLYLILTEQLGIYVGKSLTDSVYYPNLKHGDMVAFIYREVDKRPVALLDELRERYGPSITEEERQDIMRRIQEYWRSKI